MLCHEIMKPGVECLSPTSTVRLAAQKMRDLNVGFLPICDGNKKVLGTVTDRDLAVRVLAEDRPASTTVGDVMTHPVVTCRRTDNIQAVEKLMGQHHKSRIVVIDDAGAPLGILSLSDIAQHAEPSGVAQTMKKVSEREARVT